MGVFDSSLYIFDVAVVILEIINHFGADHSDSLVFVGEWTLYLDVLRNDIKGAVVGVELVLSKCDFDILTGNEVLAVCVIVDVVTRDDNVRVAIGDR